MATVTGATTSITRTLEDTPTWAVAVVCFGIISISILLEHTIHLLSTWLKERHKKALYDAVERVKSELMLLGFMSLILAATQRYIPKICIPIRVADTMLPCRKIQPITTGKTLRKLFSIDEEDIPQQVLHRQLASAADAVDHCGSKGMVSFMTQKGIHQLHIFIFVLAAMQILYSVFTMALGRAKMRRWKAWERETQTTEYLVANDPNRFQFTKQTTFGRRHISPHAENALLLWIKCFFRQFFNSVAKVDYLTLRHGFISAHLSTKNTFNFQKYIRRSLEDDFKVVVSISPFMWFVVVILLLADVHGGNVYLWVSYVPFIIVLVLGTKLQVIVARMALQLNEQNKIVIKGAPVVQPNDKFFWFGRPKFVFTLLHLILFLNAFELALFVWVMTQFGINSCYHESTEIIVIRVVLAVMVQILCSYSTLPLYALVTQMGSQYKSAVLEEQMLKAIKQWHTGVREKRKKKKLSQPSQSPPDHSSEFGSSIRNSPIEFSLHSPTFREVVPFPSINEITEECQEIIEHEPGTISSVPHRVVQLELPVMMKKNTQI